MIGLIGYGNMGNAIIKALEKIFEPSQLIIYDKIEEKTFSVKEHDFLDLVKKVASKGGTTQAALEYFEEKNFKEIIETAVQNACLRAKELEKDFN